jgi:hypothetical protein
MPYSVLSRSTRALIIVGIAGSIMLTRVTDGFAADEGQLAEGLADSMRLDQTRQHRAADSGAAIRAYIAAGYSVIQR